MYLKFRHRKITLQMDQLPIDQLSSEYPYQTTDVDYTGSFTIKVRSGRCKTTLKAYASIFVYFLTKAVHIELVETLTLDFIAALLCFISRREHPSKIVSDNGTQFVKRSLEFKVLFQGHQDEIVNFSKVLQIEWKNSFHLGLPTWEDSGKLR